LTIADLTKARFSPPSILRGAAPREILTDGRAAACPDRKLSVVFRSLTARRGSANVVDLPRRFC